jgi:hypothetical protein
MITAVLFVNAHMLVIDRVSLVIVGEPLPITQLVPMQSLLQGAASRAQRGGTQNPKSSSNVRGRVYRWRCGTTISGTRTLLSISYTSARSMTAMPMELETSPG